MAKKLFVPKGAKVVKTVPKSKPEISITDKIKDVVKGLGFAKSETDPALDAVIEKLKQEKK